MERLGDVIADRDIVEYFAESTIVVIVVNVWYAGRCRPCVQIIIGEHTLFESIEVNAIRLLGDLLQRIVDSLRRVVSASGHDVFIFGICRAASLEIPGVPNPVIE